MKGIAWVSTLLMIATVLAGCSDSGSAPVDSSEDAVVDFNAEELEAGKGAIVGVVVDQAITPVVGAAVVLQGFEMETETNENGGFVFKDLEPGTYFIEVSKPGYGKVQQNAEVTASANPPTLKVLLERIPGTEPYVGVEKWTGFIECSVRAGTGGNAGSIGLNACSIGDGVGNQDTEHPLSFDSTPDFIQMEMTWDSTQALGSGLSLVVGPETCADVKYGRYDGPSPAILSLTEEELAAQGVGTEQGLCYRVFTYTAEETAHFAGAVVSQEFDTITHHFYNFLPQEGWTFLEDGSPVPPS